MLKKRIIFKLLHDNGQFCISRNFRLQKVGNVNWLFEKFNFSEIANYIDEIAVLNVSRKNYENFLNKKFVDDIKYLTEKTFIPLTLGGGIRTANDIKKCFEIGADKIIVNSLLSKNKKIIEDAIKIYGSQAVVIGIDFKKENNKFITFINNGLEKYLEIKNHLELIKKIQPGEIFLTSIDRDGTGFGLEEQIINMIKINIPVVLSGGIGNDKHSKIIENAKVSGIMTGNLFNFIGTGLKDFRKNISLNTKVNLRNI